MGRLDGKVAIITGAGSGIGRATALLFAEEGAKVVVADFLDEAGGQTVREIRDRGGTATFTRTDVSRAKDVENMVRKAIDIYGKLDIIFNNAGIAGIAGPTGGCSEENWQRVIQTNLSGVFFGMKYAIPEMLRSGGGSVINTASIAADRGIPNLPAYAAAKGGVSALSRTTAVEYAKMNIRVNTVNPATTATQMVLGMGKEILAQHVSAIPMGRPADPKEIAYAVLFLASDESRFITGHSLVVDGGLEIDSRQRG